MPRANTMARRRTARNPPHMVFGVGRVLRPHPFHPRTMIAEDLLLLVTDDSTGKVQGDGASIDHGLAGALLCELALLRRIRLTTDSDFHPQEEPGGCGEHRPHRRSHPR
ncbi:MAG: GPP34 family phosphoprotein [Actinomycetota bacterium]